MVRVLPSPLNMSDERVEKLMCNHSRRFDSLPQQTQNLKQGENINWFNLGKNNIQIYPLSCLFLICMKNKVIYRQNIHNIS